MVQEEKKYFQDIIESVQYERNAFTIWYGDEKIIIGALIPEESDAQKFFSYATIYHTLLDVDWKIKYSLYKAIDYAESADFQKWNPIKPASKNEKMALYYVENAIFRTEVLWELLAQMFNMKENIGKPIDKIYAAQLFHDAQQGKKANVFAKRVYEYMQKLDNSDVEPWEGNYTYVKGIRDKLTHRNAPAISTMSNFDINLRMPAIYILKRVIEEYKQISSFIAEYVHEILGDYQQLNNTSPEEIIYNETNQNDKRI